MAMVKEASLRESPSANNNHHNRKKSKEELELEIAMRELLRMSKSSNVRLVKKSSLRRLSSEEQMQSFRKSFKHMSPKCYGNHFNS